MTNGAPRLVQVEKGRMKQEAEYVLLVSAWLFHKLKGMQLAAHQVKRGSV